MEYHSVQKEMSCQALGRHGGNPKGILLSEKMKRLVLYDSNYGETMETGEERSGCRGWDGGTKRQSTLKLLEDSETALRRYNGGYMSFIICPNPQNVHHQE